MEQSSEIKNMAHHEIEAWKAHNRKDSNKLTKHMASLYKLLYGTPMTRGIEAGRHTVKAAWLHDLAEALGDEGNADESKKYWNQVLDELTEHYKLLLPKNSIREETARKLAMHDTKRWQVHHDRDYEALIREMSAMYSILLSIQQEKVLGTLSHVIKALQIHDRAEAYESKGEFKKANVYWDRAELELQNHFRKLTKLSNNV